MVTGSRERDRKKEKIYFSKSFTLKTKQNFVHWEGGERERNEGKRENGK